MYEPSAAERTRALLLQVALVAMVVLGGLAVFDTVSSATEPMADSMDGEVEPQP